MVGEVGEERRSGEEQAGVGLLMNSALLCFVQREGEGRRIEGASAGSVNGTRVSSSRPVIV
jgi:hypothetical protein